MSLSILDARLAGDWKSPLVLEVDGPGFQDGFAGWEVGWPDATGKSRAF
jgi:hypothetical protein